MLKETKIAGKSGKVVGIIIVAVAIVAVAAVALFIVPNAAEAKKLTEKLDLGSRYLAELNYEQAEVEYLAAIEINPKREDAYLGLAEVYIATGELDKAKEILEEGLREAENYSELIGLLEQVCQELGVSMPEIEKSSSGNGDSGTSGEYDESLVNPDFPESTAPAFSASTAVIGNQVVFGSYEQDNIAENGPEAIEWTVIDVQDGQALLVSKYVIDSRPFGIEGENISWGHSGLRAWLNGEFYNEVFTESEKQCIVPQEISVDFFSNGCYDPLYDTYEPGYDRVSLLTLEQAAELFMDDSGLQECWVSKERATKPTPYALSKGIAGFYLEEEYLESMEGFLEGDWYLGNCDWYLRTEMWEEGAMVRFVDYAGIICDEWDNSSGSATNVSNAIRRLSGEIKMGIRPCIYVIVE